jgi:hypothetical protein
MEMHNTTRQRANKHKVLPHGIPEEMFRFPQMVDACDFKVRLHVLMSDWWPNMFQIIVLPDMLDEAEAKWAPPEDPVFQLVPPTFENYVTQCFEDLGKPEVTFETFWDVYCELWDLVEVAVPEDVTMTLGESIRSDVGMKEPFELVDLEEPQLGHVVESEDDGGEDEVPCVDFTNEKGRDQLF